MTIADIADVPRLWIHLRIWWHRTWYRPIDVTPVDDLTLLISCSCGGFAQVRRNEDTPATVEHATCPLWRRVYLVRVPLPIARLLP